MEVPRNKRRPASDGGIATPPQGFSPWGRSYNIIFGVGCGLYIQAEGLDKSSSNPSPTSTTREEGGGILKGGRDPPSARGGTFGDGG